MIAYGLFIDSCVDGGCPITSLLELYEEKITADKRCAELNAKYPIEVRKGDWTEDLQIQEGEICKFNNTMIAGGIEFGIGEFYVKPVGVKEGE